MRLNLTQNIRSALRALMANKLRSALTMLGIVIGVGSVVALLLVGTGAQASITGQISNIGANLITGDVAWRGGWWAARVDACGSRELPGGAAEG